MRVARRLSVASFCHFVTLVMLVMLFRIKC
jgi:hypothetical protein